MHPNAALIARFYEAFQRRDAATMGACYHHDVQFSDEIFPELHGDAARAMWTMLCERGKDLTIACSNVHADSATGRAQWDAWYTFSGSGRRVHNRIRAEFTFEGGRIVRHRDRFGFWRWARQALGPAGVLLGWSGFLRRRVQAQAARSLREWAHRAPTASLIVLAMLALAGCAARPPTVAPSPPERMTSVDLLRRLGRPDTARLVIIHGDDVAMTPAATAATLSALRSHGISSASVIVTTPYLGALGDSLRAGRASLDLGVHLALTSESPSMRWTPSAPRRSVRALVDSSGHFPLRAVGAPITAEIEREVETEIAAQVARVRDAGVTPTHLDSHQGALLYGGPELFRALRRVAKRECLPVPVPESYFTRFPYLAEALDDGQPPLANLVSIGTDVPPAEWEAFYSWVFETMRPGVTLLLLHLGEDTAHERALFRDHAEWNAAWRARDAAMVTRGTLAGLARRYGIEVVDWREITRVSTICAR